MSCSEPRSWRTSALHAARQGSRERFTTDGGSEFNAQFDQVCRELNVQHTCTKPRHAWTNGFVERLKKTILHEHWRIAFRRRYFRRRHRFLSSTTSSDRIRATGPKAGHPPRSSGAPYANNTMRRPGVSTPFPRLNSLDPHKPRSSDFKVAESALTIFVEWVWKETT